jgi:hypothetical protein
MRKNLLKFVSAVSALSLTALAAAQSEGPPDMPAIEFPVDTDSVISGFLAAGGVILLAVIAIGLPFALARKLIARATRKV